MSINIIDMLALYFATVPINIIDVTHLSSLSFVILFDSLQWARRQIFPYHE